MTPGGARRAGATRRLADAIHNRYRVPAFLANSLPKAGTNLLVRALGLLGGDGRGARRVPHLAPAALQARARARDAAGPGVAIGLTWPRLVPARTLRRVLRRMRRGTFCSVHAPYSGELAALLAELSMKTVLIVRDPRDVAVSSAYYIARTPANQFHGIYRPLSLEDRILLSIRGRPPARPGDPRIEDIGTVCRTLLPWLAHPACLTVRFHRLVGPQGGGREEDQVAELSALAAHLGFRVRPDALAGIARALFGGTPTFREGRSGAWRDHFTREHREVFKAVAGQVLVDLGYERDPDW
jgi:hypothetical protein